MIFLYQTFDGCDGKQARRTKSSSILGELFDHGCDAVTNIWIHLVLAHCMGFGLDHRPFIVVVGAMFTFMMFTFEKRFTGVLRTGLPFYGIIEGQYTAIGLVVATGVYGNEIWARPLFEISGTPWSFRDCGILFSWFQIPGSLLTCLPSAIKAAAEHGETSTLIQYLIPNLSIYASVYFAIAIP